MVTHKIRLRLGQLIAAALAGALWIGGCSPFQPAGDVDGPEPANDLRVTATAADANVFTGSQARMTAAPSGGTPPYSYRWDQNSGPTDATVNGVTASSVTTSSLSEAGRYVFRVVVTDAADLHETDYVPVTVLDPVEADVPPLAVVNEAVFLSADTGDAPAGTTVRWDIAGGSAEISDPADNVTELTATAPGSIDLTLTIEVPGGTTPLVKNFEIAAIPNNTPRVLLETSMGDFTIELDADSAPLHTANFLLYVDDGFYDGLLIHRVVCRTVTGAEECQPFVIQSGGYEREDREITGVEVTRDPVKSEADNGLSNGELYSVALALAGSNPDSGTTQFFVNLDEGNDSLDGQGFTVFGSVVAGQSVVDEIVRVPTETSPLIPNEQSLPVDDIVIERMSRIAG